MRLTNPPRRPPRFALARLSWLLLAAVVLTGCRGCGGTDPTDPQAAAKKKEAEEKEAKEKEDKEQPAFEISPITPLLSESLVDANEGRAIALAKPGHWVAAAQRVKANDSDLEATTSVEVLDSQGNPQPLPDTGYNFISSRPAVLAKGQEKRIETELFIPEGLDRFQVAARLERAVTGYSVGDAPPPQPWRAMPSYQYFFIVLAEEPAQYTFLKVTDAVRAPRESDSGRFALHYRVVLADGKQMPPLPGNALQWTSVAHLWWDGADPDRLTPEQQTALVDWLHWGGRLVINGPDSLDVLRGSFLGTYLPAEPGKAREYTADDVAPLSRAWSQRSAGRDIESLRPTKPWSGVTLKPLPGASETPGTGGLFVERQVGLGTVLVSAVQLTQRELVNWPGFDGLLNGAILGRPRRLFQVEKGDFFTGLEVDWADYPQRQLDARFTTPLRWMARDLGAKTNMRDLEIAPNPQANPYGLPSDIPELQTVVDRRGGAGAWSDFGRVADAARGALREAAGVTVPGAGFVIACLTVYLIVLVPLNWMVFHSLRKVEWAWLAAPVIALAGAAAVIQQARLDIGFVSSQTEIGFLELQGDHPRGHLSRFAGLYTSLSTTYDIEYEQPTAVAVPFPGAADQDETRSSMLHEGGTVAFEKYGETKLRGLAVASSTTRLVHSEEFVPFSGVVRLSKSQSGLQQLSNRLGTHLFDAMLVRRSFDRQGKPRYDGCWLGELRDGASTIVSFSPLSRPGTSLPFVEERAAAAERAELSGRPRLDVDKLTGVALVFAPADDPLYGAREETRLVARIDELLPGATARPDASQTAGAVVVCIHLAYGPPPAPRPDANSVPDVQPEGSTSPYEDEPIDTFEAGEE